ncbi:MAG: hypothetical protein EP338_08840 [Bacteroidetes bacterium]|nr:MAG: hypothetical protein EP338_08840 [Bacteroidota bacterium]
MMKRLLVLSTLFLLLASFGTYRIDAFSVIKVIGGIRHAQTNKSLFTGDKVFSNERLKFNDQQSKAALINKEKGRIMLRASRSGIVSEGLMPALPNVSSRAGALINQIDIEKHFSDKYLILSGYEAEISPKKFPMDQNHFFFLRYSYQGEDISKKLNFEENKLQLNADEIMQVDGKRIELSPGTKMTLFYRNNEEKTSEAIALFEPVFANEKDLVQECKLILREIGEGLDAGAKKEQLLAYLTENYGKPQQDNLNNWLHENLGL